MAYNYEWPYVDPNRHNSDWELNKVKELDARVTAAEQEIADFEEAMKNDWADYQDKINGQIDDFTGGMISQWNDYKQEMNRSWTTYQNSLNASWAAYQTKLNGDWDAYKTQMGTDWANYQQSINAQWAQYKTDTNADIAAWKAGAINDLDTWKAGAINDLDTWKTATTADLMAWKQQANTDIASWEAATSASLDADFAQYRQTTDSAITAWETATSANLNKLMDDYKALINGEWAQYKTDTDADIAAFKSSVNVSLSGMDSRITAMQTAVTTLQSDWATFQTTIQGDITMFENSVNSTLSSMRQDMTDFESDINAKISTQNAQIASMQTAVNNIPTTVDRAVDNKFNNLTPPYSAVGIMWENYHDYIKKQYNGIVGATLITCGSVQESNVDAVLLLTGITVTQRKVAQNYTELQDFLSGTAFKIVMISSDFTGAVNTWGSRLMRIDAPTIVIRDFNNDVLMSITSVHAILTLQNATAFYSILNGVMYGPRTETAHSATVHVQITPRDSCAEIWGSVRGNVVIQNFPIAHTVDAYPGFNMSNLAPASVACYYNNMHLDLSSIGDVNTGFHFYEGLTIK